MAKANSLVNLVLMSIVTAVRFTISQLKPFNRVTSIGGGLIGYNYLKPFNRVTSIGGGLIGYNYYPH